MLSFRNVLVHVPALDHWEDGKVWLLVLLTQCHPHPWDVRNAYHSFPVGEHGTVSHSSHFREHCKDSSSQGLAFTKSPSTFLILNFRGSLPIYPQSHNFQGPRINSTRHASSLDFTNLKFQGWQEP